MDAEGYGLELEYVNWMLKQLDWMLNRQVCPYFLLFCIYVGLLGMRGSRCRCWSRWNKAGARGLEAGAGGMELDQVGWRLE